MAVTLANVPNETHDPELRLTQQLRELTAQCARTGHLFAEANDLYASDFRALLLMDAAEQSGGQLTAGELAHQLNLSSGAVTYLVERLVSSGHVVRESDPNDRRKVLLARSSEGKALCREFNTPLGSLVHVALAEFSPEELDAASRVLARFQRAGELYQEELSEAAVAAGRARATSRRKAQ